MDIDIDIVYIDINKVLEQEAKLNELIIVFLSLYSYIHREPLYPS